MDIPQLNYGYSKNKYVIRPRKACNIPQANYGYSEDRPCVYYD